MLTDKKVKLDIEERQIQDLLIGRAVGITVSEPWDFEYPESGRMLAGYIADAGADGEAVDNGRQRQWVSVELDAPADPGARDPELEIDHLKATLRHVCERDILEQLLAGDYPAANLSYGDQVPRDEMPEGDSPFFIGTIALKSVWARHSHHLSH